MPCELNVQAGKTLAATSDLVRRDSNIPGLGLVLDPARLLAALRGQLDISRVDDIKLVYLRYKPGMNCLVRYQLYTDGCTISAYAKAHGEDAASKMSKSMERTVIDGALGPGRVVLEDRQVIFSTFPNDAKLASLRCLSDADYRQRLFSRLFGPDSKWQGSTLGQPLNYKPERRYVVRLTRADGESALVKFYSRSGYAKARTISRRLGGNREGFYPKTLGRSKKHALIAYQWQPGITLRQLSNDGKLDLSDFTAVADSLVEFHGSGRGGLSPLKPGEQNQRLSALAEQAGFLLPHLYQRAKRVAQQLAQWLDSQVPVRQPVHGDFYDKQVIVSAGNVRLIDLDAARLDNPLLDLGSYIAHLERQVSNHAMAVTDAETQIGIFVSSYEKLTGSIDTGQLNKYIALGLFDLIHQPFRDWAADWPEQTDQLLQQVENLFAA